MYTQALFSHAQVIYLYSLCTNMYVGMMIESMAGKSASLHGLCLDATPFTFSEDMPAVDYYGQLLVKG